MIARILCTDLAGLRAQALGLVEAAGFEADMRTLRPRGVFRHLSPGLWPAARWVVAGDALAAPLPPLVIGAGGAGAKAAAQLRRAGVAVVAVQHPRMALDKFDLVLAAAHDRLTGPNVIITRTALHRATPARLAAAAAAWRPVLAAAGWPLVAVLLGGANGRYRFGAAEAEALAGRLAALGKVGLAITPSRRTAPAVLAVLRARLPAAWIWDGAGENPYFGMLGAADAIVVTGDSVSMLSEAVATAVPVFVARLPGRSARIGAFVDALVAAGRVRDFAGRLELWDTAPLDDTAAAAAQMRDRLGL